MQHTWVSTVSEFNKIQLDTLLVTFGDGGPTVASRRVCREVENGQLKSVGFDRFEACFDPKGALSRNTSTTAGFKLSTSGVKFGPAFKRGICLEMGLFGNQTGRPV
jgi:hypothetical protein